MHRRAILIQHSSSPEAPCWEELLTAQNLAIAHRELWTTLKPEKLSEYKEKLLLLDAVPKTQQALQLFSWLRENPTPFATFAILPSNDPEFIRLAADAVDDFVLWPMNMEEFRQRLLRLLGPNVDSVDGVRNALLHELGLASMVGNDPAFCRVLTRVSLFASHEAPVLLTGETGTGKELCARVIHLLSRRRAGPFIPVECGAVPDQLFENELFGHVRGAYTDARGEQKGLVALAHAGTLFLDEVDSLSLAAQGKLLRLLQEGSFRSLGSDRFVEADIRIIAACNSDLNQLVAERRFRADLYFRLDVLRIHLPPLRERAGDIVMLARTFGKDVCNSNGVAAKNFSPSALRKLQSYDWPGNVRELYNAVQRALLTAAGREILPGDIDIPCCLAGATMEDIDFRTSRQQAIETFEVGYVRRLLEKHGGNITRAARDAGKERRAFGRLAKKYRTSNR